MSTARTIAPEASRSSHSLSLFHLMEPEVLADPYPLYRRLQIEAPVNWDPFLHAWVVTRYNDVITIFQEFSADRTPTPEHLSAMGLSHLNPIASIMVKQMLFLDGAAHARLRGLCSAAFTPRRIEGLRSHIQEIVDGLLDAVCPAGRMELMADLANPLPAIVTAELMGLPTSDHRMLKGWSADFAEMLGNFQHNPDRVSRVLRSVGEMTEYFRSAVHEQSAKGGNGLLHALVNAEVDGSRLSEEEIIANCILTMVGGQETTTNLIGSGTLTLLRNPAELERLRSTPALIPSAVEELLRYETPSQHTWRIAPRDFEMGGKTIRKGQKVVAVMAAANRDPEKFPDPDRLDLARKDNRHVTFGYGPHFCFGAPLGRMEGQIAFETMLRRLPNLALTTDSLEWRYNLAMRGLVSLPVVFG